MATQFSVEENRAWKRPFFTIWILQALSLLGSGLVQFAIIWYLTIKTDSATVLATASMVGLLPGVFIAPFTGALVDRWNRRTIIIASDATVALLTVLLALLFLFNVVETWHIYLLLFLRAIGGRFHGPALTASTSLMVPKEHLARIQGLNQTIGGGLLMVSAPLGALLIALLPMQGILAIDIVTAVLAIVPLIFIAIPQPERGPVTTAKQSSLFTDMKAGLQYMLGWKGLLIFTLTWTLLMFLFAPMVSLMPLLVKNHFGGSAFHLGWMTLSYGLGMTLGGLSLSIWGGFNRRILTTITAFICIGVGDVVLGLTPSSMFYLALGTQVWVGFMVSFANASFGAILQSTVEPGMQGRVFSLSGSVSQAVVPVSLMIAGPVADWLGIQFWILIAGIACTIMGFVMFGIPAVMNIEEGNKHVSSGSSVDQVFAKGDYNT
jgi:DHA3 family macrolide efflux protein-like MFS transporter